jgi:pimeloyl-ACP methyl ester carboxylesterase
MGSKIATDILQLLRTDLFLLLDIAVYEAWMLRQERRDSAARAEVGDIDIYYRRYGSGDPVLMLHGGFAFAENWIGQIPALARHYRVIAPDSRGHGRTTLGTQPLTYRQMAADAAGLIEKLGLGSVHLVGWSDGGCTSLALAMERPELVRSMTLLGTPFHTDNYGEEGKRRVARILQEGSPTLLGLQAVRRFLTPEPARGREFTVKIRELWTNLPDFTVEELGRIQAPTLVIGCDRDEFLSLWPDPLQVFKDTTAAIPNAKLAVVRGGTHGVGIDRPRTLNRLLLDFMRGL